MGTLTVSVGPRSMETLAVYVGIPDSRDKYDSLYANTDSLYAWQSTINNLEPWQSLWEHWQPLFRLKLNLK